MNGGTLAGTTLFTYDEQNRQTSFIGYQGDPNDGIIPTVAYAVYYDENGNLSKAIKRGPFTIPEANVLTKDGPVNTITFTW